MSAEAKQINNTKSLVFIVIILVCISKQIWEQKSSGLFPDSKVLKFVA